MSTLQQIPDQVQWFEGMLLSPQHFQQNNFYFEQLINQKIALTQPFYWGITRLEVDSTAITRNEIHVRQVEGIMPDGTYVRYGMETPEQEKKQPTGDIHLEVDNCLKLELKKLEQVKTGTILTVFLAVPIMSDACASDDESERKRYDSVNVGKIIDNNDINNKVDLVRLRPRLQLLVGEQYDKSKYSGIPLFKLKAINDGDFTQEPFTPPILSVTKTAIPHNVTIGTRLEKLLTDIHNKAKGLRDFFVDRSNDFNIVSNLQKQRIHHMMAHYPNVEMLLNTEQVHPFELYKALVSMVGQIALLHSSNMPPSIPGYYHDDIDATFNTIIEFISEIISEISLNFTAVPFQEIENNKFEVFVDKLPAKDEPFKIVCQYSKGSTPEMLQKWMQSAQISSESYWGDLLLSRISGAERKIVKQFSDLKVTLGDKEVFFEITNTDNLIKENDKLIIGGTEDSLKEHKPAFINWYIAK